MKKYKLYEGLDKPKYYYLVLTDNNEKSIIEIAWNLENKIGGYTAWLQYNDNILLNTKLVEDIDTKLKEYCEMLSSKEFLKHYIQEELELKS